MFDFKHLAFILVPKGASECIASANVWRELNVSTGKPTIWLAASNFDKNNYSNSITLSLSTTDILLAIISLEFVTLTAI